MDPNTLTSLAHLTWQEAHTVFERRPLILLPVGSLEAHGPHLPLDTDVALSISLAESALQVLRAEGREVWIAPALPFGVTEFAAPFTGTVSIKAATLRALLEDVCSSLIHQGAAGVVLINSHLELAHIQVLREVSKDLSLRLPAPVIFPDHTRRRWVATLSKEFQDGACHAGSYETSLMMVSRPEAVRPVHRDLPPFQVDLAQAMRNGAHTFRDAGSELAYFGEPALATPREGEDLQQRLTEMVVTTVRETLPSE